MLEAFGLGLLGASSLLLAGLFACWVDVPPVSSACSRASAQAR